MSIILDATGDMVLDTDGNPIYDAGVVAPICAQPVLLATLSGISCFAAVDAAPEITVTAKGNVPDSRGYLQLDVNVGGANTVIDFDAHLQLDVDVKLKLIIDAFGVTSTVAGQVAPWTILSDISQDSAVTGAMVRNGFSSTIAVTTRVARVEQIQSFAVGSGQYPIGLGPGEDI